MITLLRLFAEIALLRRGPQDVPYAQAFLVLALALALAARLATGAALELGVWMLPRALLEMAIVLLVLNNLLSARGLPERRVQTLTALFGTLALVQFLALPFTRMLFLAREDPSQLPAVIALLWFGLFCWSFVVAAHVYRNALNTSFAGGMLVAVLLFALTTLTDAMVVIGTGEVGGAPEAGS